MVDFGQNTITNREAVLDAINSVSGGGGTTPTLQQVSDEGNTSTNTLNFAGVTTDTQFLISSDNASTHLAEIGVWDFGVGDLSIQAKTLDTTTADSQRFVQTTTLQALESVSPAYGSDYNLYVSQDWIFATKESSGTVKYVESSNYNHVLTDSRRIFGDLSQTGIIQTVDDGFVDVQIFEAAADFISINADIYARDFVTGTASYYNAAFACKGSGTSVAIYVDPLLVGGVLKAEFGDFPSYNTGTIHLALLSDTTYPTLRITGETGSTIEWLIKVTVQYPIV